MKFNAGESDKPVNVSEEVKKSQQGCQSLKTNDALPHPTPNPCTHPNRHIGPLLATIVMSKCRIKPVVFIGENDKAVKVVSLLEEAMFT